MRNNSGTTRPGLIITLVVGALFGAVTARAADVRRPTLESIGNQVMCVCGGCVAPLGQCPHMDCGTKAEMKAYIRRKSLMAKMKPRFSRT